MIHNYTTGRSIGITVFWVLLLLLRLETASASVPPVLTLPNEDSVAGPYNPRPLGSKAFIDPQAVQFDLGGLSVVGGEVSLVSLFADDWVSIGNFGKKETDFSGVPANLPSVFLPSVVFVPKKISFKSIQVSDIGAAPAPVDAKQTFRHAGELFYRVDASLSRNMKELATNGDFSGRDVQLFRAGVTDFTLIAIENVLDSKDEKKQWLLLRYKFKLFIDYGGNGTDSGTDRRVPGHLVHEARDFNLCVRFPKAVDVTKSGNSSMNDFAGLNTSQFKGFIPAEGPYIFSDGLYRSRITVDSISPLNSWQQGLELGDNPILYVGAINEGMKYALDQIYSPETASDSLATGNGNDSNGRGNIGDLDFNPGDLIHRENVRTKVNEQESQAMARVTKSIRPRVVPIWGFLNFWAVLLRESNGSLVSDFWKIGGTPAPVILNYATGPLTMPSGQFISYQVAASGAPKSFTATNLPPGLSLNSRTGLISGTPTTSGTYLIPVTATSPSGTGTATITFNVVSPSAKTAQSITFGPLSGKVKGELPFSLNASATSGLPVVFSVVTGPATISGNVVTLLDTGTVTIRAAQAGNETYAPAASIDQSFVVTVLVATVPVISTLPGQTVPLNLPTNQSFSYQIAASGAPTVFTASNLPNGLSLNSATGLISGTPTVSGTYTVQITASNSLGAGKTTVTFVVGVAPGKVAQSINFGSLPNKVKGDAPFSLSASATSGLPVVFSVVSGPATINGNVVTLLDAGTIVMRAFQAGNANYEAAPPVDRTFVAALGATAPTAVKNYAPLALSSNARIALTGQVVDSFAGSYSETSMLLVTSESEFQGGTFTYLRAGFDTAQVRYTLRTQSSGESETKIGLVTLTFSSHTGGSYASTGTYTGASFGASYSGSFSGSGTFTYAPPAGAPVITSQVVGQTSSAGGTATLAISATGASTYQWQRNGNDLSGRTASTLVLSNVQAADRGAYSVVVGNAAARVLSDTVTLVVEPATTPVVAARLVNLSILTSLASLGDSFTMGYVVGGKGTIGAKSLVVRAAGPSLGALGLGGTLDDPKLELFAGSHRTGENDNWGGTAALANAMAVVGAFSYSSPSSRDAAAALSIPAGDNSVIITGGNGTGTVIAEIYDATPAASFTTATPRLINVSVRKHLGSGLTMGFVVGGAAPANVLVRCIGPSLGAFGVPGTVVDPQLTLFNSLSVKIGENNDWAGTAELTAAFASVGAFGLPAASKDAALVVTLQPGNYTVVATGTNNTTGVAIMEVYEIP